MTHTPPKFNMEPEHVFFSKGNLVFQGWIFRFHVKLKGCSWFIVGGVLS